MNDTNDVVVEDISVETESEKQEREKIKRENDKFYRKLHRLLFVGSTLMGVFMFWCFFIKK